MLDVRCSTFISFFFRLDRPFLGPAAGLTSVFRPQPSDFCLPPSVFRPLSSVLRSLSPVFGPPSSDLGLLSTDFGYRGALRGARLLGQRNRAFGRGGFFFALEYLDHIVDVLRRWTNSHTKNELFELGQLKGFPWAPVSSPMEIADSPQLKARNFFIGIEHPEAGLSLPYPGLPFKFSTRFTTKHKPPPPAGKDNALIYGEDLGLSEKELHRLSSIHVI